MIKLLKVQAVIDKSAGTAEAGLVDHEEIMSIRESVDESHNTIEIIDDLLAKFMQVADQAVSNLETKADRVPVDGVVTREGGRLTANVQYDDGSEKNIAAVREGGGLRIVPPDAEG